MKFLGDSADYLSRAHYCHCRLLLRQLSLSQIQDISASPRNVSFASALEKNLCNLISLAPSLDISINNILLPPYALWGCNHMHLHTSLFLCAQAPETKDHFLYGLWATATRKNHSKKTDNTLMTKVCRLGQLLSKIGITCQPFSLSLSIYKLRRLLNTGMDSQQK